MLLILIDFNWPHMKIEIHFHAWLSSLNFLKAIQYFFLTLKYYSICANRIDMNYQGRCMRCICWQSVWILQMTYYSITPGRELDFYQTDLHFDPDSQHDRQHGKVADPLLWHCNPSTGNYRFLQGNPCNENRIPAMRTGFPVMRYSNVPLIIQIYKL